MQQSSTHFTRETSFIFVSCVGHFMWGLILETTCSPACEKLPLPNLRVSLLEGVETPGTFLKTPATLTASLVGIAAGRHQKESPRGLGTG